jgi:hypothetical protein
MIEHGSGHIPHLPSVSTYDLNGVRRTLPNGRLNVLLIAYRRWQQLEVDTWLPALDELERRHGGLGYYELPVVGEMNGLGRRALDHVMRRGIGDREVRSRTLTFYRDSAGFREPLGIPDEDHIAVVLVDGDGLVLWRASGPYDPSLERALAAAVRSATSTRVH